MRYWNMARQRYVCGLARCGRALRLSADRAENAARKRALFGALIEESGSHMTRRWREESAANSSLKGKYREFRRFGAWRRLRSSENGHEISFLRANSLRILAGNFLRSCRELNRAIREVSAVIRESHFRPLFGIRPGDKSDHWRRGSCRAP